MDREIKFQKSVRQWRRSTFKMSSLLRINATTRRLGCQQSSCFGRVNHLKSLITSLESIYNLLSNELGLSQLEHNPSNPLYNLDLTRDVKKSGQNSQEKKWERIPVWLAKPVTERLSSHNVRSGTTPTLVFAESRVDPLCLCTTCQSWMRRDLPARHATQTTPRTGWDPIWHESLIRRLPDRSGRMWAFQWNRVKHTGRYQLVSITVKSLKDVIAIIKSITLFIEWPKKKLTSTDGNIQK